jgi:hypothetical protein
MDDSGHSFSTADVIGLLSRHRLLVVVCIAAFVVVAMVASYLMTPVYRAEALLSPVLLDGGRQADGLATRYLNLAGLTDEMSSGNETAQLMAVLTSRSFTFDFVKEKGVAGILFPKLWDERNGRWLESAGRDTPTRWQVYNYFDSSVRHVYLDDDTGLITLSVEWSDPDVAAEWANGLVERVNKHLRRLAREEGERSLEFLSEELQSTGAQEVREAIYRLMEVQLRNVMLANVREDFGFKVVDPAIAPELPVRPNRRVMAVASALLGLCAGFLVAAAIERSGAAASDG